MADVKEIKKLADLFNREYAVKVSVSRKNIDVEKTRKIGKYTGYGVDSKKSDVNNYEVFEKVVNQKQFENNLYNLIFKDLSPKDFLKDKQILNALGALARKSYLKSQKRKSKKDKQAPKGIFSGQLFKSFFAEREK